MNKLYFAIGASGAGKTAAIKGLEKRRMLNLQVCYFDSIGVPSPEEMIKEYGSADEWQRMKTIDWVRKIKTDYLPDRNVVLDGQTRPIFIEEACEKIGIDLYEIILFDCSDDIRKQRLVERGHPYLADKLMMNWAKYLREECISRGCKIIDTSNLSIDQGASRLSDYL